MKINDKISVTFLKKSENKPVRNYLNINPTIRTSYAGSLDALAAQGRAMVNLGTSFKGFLTSMQKKIDEKLPNPHIYFQNLTDKNGEPLISDLENFSKYMSTVNPSSAEASTLEMLIQLIQDGIVDKHVLKHIRGEGRINDAVSSDIDKLYEAYSLKINPADMFVPEFNSEQEALKCGDALEEGVYKAVKTGDVFYVKGEKNIRIRTGEKTSKKLNISKKTYLKLFPPVERYASTQNEIGNCWEISGINSLLFDKDMRVNLYSLFYEKGNDIIIKFPNGKCSGIKFKDGRMPDNTDKKYYSEGALGVKMLEYADGREMKQKEAELFLELNGSNKKTAADFKKLVKKCGGNILIHEMSEYKPYDGKFDNAFSEIRDGRIFNPVSEYVRSTDKLYNRIGLNSEYIVLSEKYKEKLSDPKFFKNHAAVWTAKKSGDGSLLDKSFLNEKFALNAQHAYCIEPSRINETGKIETFNILNPHSILKIELTLDEIFKYGSALFTAEKPPACSAD